MILQEVRVRLVCLKSDFDSLMERINRREHCEEFEIDHIWEEISEIRSILHRSEFSSTFNTPPNIFYESNEMPEDAVSRCGKWISWCERRIENILSNEHIGNYNIESIKHTEESKMQSTQNASESIESLHQKNSGSNTYINNIFHNSVGNVAHQVSGNQYSGEVNYPLTDTNPQEVLDP